MGIFQKKITKNFDEPLLKKYKGNLIVETGPDQSTVQSWNKICADVDADLSMIAGDEIQFITQGWDERMRDTRREHKHGVYAMNFWFDKLKYSEDFRYGGSQPVVTREWYKALGWHYPPYFWHWYVDTYTQNVARKLNRCLYFPNVTIKAKKVFDDTGKQVRKHLVINDRDDYVWTKIKDRHLNADVKLLTKTIEEYK